MAYWREMQDIILRELIAMGGKGVSQDIYQRIAKYFPQKSSELMKQNYVRGGDKRGDNKWAVTVRGVKSFLVKRGELTSSKRGVWEITEAGRKRITEKP